MKRILLSLMFVASVSFVFAQNYQIKDLNLNQEVQKTLKMQKNLRGTGIDNADFENWHSDYAAYGLGDMPNGWFMMTGNQADQQNSDAQSGSSAMHVESNVTSVAALGWTDTLVGGAAFIGDLAGTSIVQGEPYTDRLISMSFYAKGELMSTDTALVVMQLFKEGTYIGGAGLYLGAADLGTSYQEYSADFTYESAQMPDTAMIIVSSTGVGVFTGMDIGTLTAGSYIDVDNMTFEVEDITDPVAGLAPSSWDAGSIEISTSTTSGDFTLTNAGVGTLEVTTATDLSGTPFSTDFVAGDVSLAAGEDYTFAFDFEPTTAGTYDETFTIETNGGTVEVALSGSGHEPCSIIDTYPFEEGFESAVPPACWTSLNEDGDGFNWTQIDYNFHGGDYAAMSASYDNDEGALTPDNYLITPELDVNANLGLSFWVAAQDADWPEEKYSVMVSTTGTAAADFTEIYTETLSSDTWTEVTLPLTDYQGETIYIAFRHWDSSDEYQIVLDDVLVDVGVGSDMHNANSNIVIYPNPANNVVNINNAENADISILNMLGQKVASQTATSSRETINISDLSNGTYIIRIEDGNEVTTQKLNVVK